MAVDIRACPSCRTSVAAGTKTCPVCKSSILWADGRPLTAVGLSIEITSTPEEPPPPRTPGPPLDSLLTPHVSALQTMGWHVTMSPAEIALHRYFKNGKCRKTPDVYLLDRTADPESPALYPYYLGATGVARARTFKSAATAIDTFLIEARRLAPRKEANQAELVSSGPMSLREILTRAVADRESVRVIYHGGRHAGSVREIRPLSVTETAVRALDPTEGIEKTFVLARMALPTSDTKAPVYSPPARPRAEWFYLEVVGESHRQGIIRDHARPGQLVELLYEIDELDNSEGMFVYLTNGEQVGRLDFDRARQMHEETAAGYRYAAVLHRVTGGTPEKSSLGIVLRVVRGYPGVSEEEFQRALIAAKTAPDAMPPQR